MGPNRNNIIMVSGFCKHPCLRDIIILRRCFGVCQTVVFSGR